MTTPMPDADGFLMGGGVPSAKFPTIGTTITGTIDRRPEVQQRQDFDTSELLFWPDGKPQLQLKVVLRTEERDPQVDDDEGLRGLYVKGQMQKAVQSAVRTAGAKGLDVGGLLTVTYSGDGEAKGRKAPPKIYTAAYVAADPLAAAADPEPPKAAPASSATPPWDQVPAGVDPAVWAALTADQRAAVQAAAQQAS